VLYLAVDLGTALAEAFPGQWPTGDICPHARAGWVHPPAPVPLSRGAGRRGGGNASTSSTRISTASATTPRTRGGESIVLWERAAAPVRAGGGDRKLWAVWRRVRVELAGQGRAPRRVAAASWDACRGAGY
jgi:hypothetical protein